MRTLNTLQKIILTILAVLLVVCIVSGIFLYQVATTIATGSEAVSQGPLSSTPMAVATPSTNTMLDPSSVLGIDSGPPSSYPGIAWTRVSYQTCGGKANGTNVKSIIRHIHAQGAHVLLLLCQSPGKHLLDITHINEVAQSGADAVACGNEEMKHNTYATYVAPADFARFFDLCERTVHTAHPGIPVLLGSLDPHVGGVDHQPLLEQVQYLDEMETAMNTIVHPGGNWSWRAQTVGLIDSWHNGYPNQNVNSLQALFAFWAQQFGVNLKSGDLGKHLWVVEGTGCVNGCGLSSKYQISVAHILALITDVQTALHYHVPFFYFSGKDFVQQGAFWPMGVLDVDGRPKPLRQDLKVKSPALSLSCPGGQIQVTEQEQLLAKLYSGCTLPNNYVEVLTR